MYCCNTQALLAILEDSGNAASAEEIRKLREGMRLVRSGMLSVGIKIHILPELRKHFDQLIFDVSTYNKKDNLGNMYRATDAWLTLVLPPVGSAQAAIRLVRALEHFVGAPLFGNRHAQMQICSPGKLLPDMCSFLGAGFYLCADRIRSYSRAQFSTTASYDNSYRRGERLVLYDAYSKDIGQFDPDFLWWTCAGEAVVILPRFPFPPSRTDVLVGITDPQDIENVNLIATLLIHRQYRGAWANVGSWFVDRVREIFARHELSGVLAAPWVTDWTHRTEEAVVEADGVFATALGELSGYALDEARRCERQKAVSGILAEMTDVMRFVRYCVDTRNVWLGTARGDTE